MLWVDAKALINSAFPMVLLILWLRIFVVVTDIVVILVLRKEKATWHFGSEMSKSYALILIVPCLIFSYNIQ